MELFYQRPKDKQIHLGSGRDAALIEWNRSIDRLIIDLRLYVKTDIIGLPEFLYYNGYAWDLEDCGGTNTVLHMSRYAAIVSHREGLQETGGATATGATELEALAKAAVNLVTQSI